ncbi:MAG: FIST N-terminal domain-containing protein [Candidatus Omnitrophota bacterium]|nr:FIST C-terminal domain-containing protein [Candidatus Omnitrophota bacterium]MBU1928261.1 FIST C-terminal domain-containing protein [Candidatus Omnitrophota bacterium]MBU2034927.1 FIST C-terminal domain-containing protein [Candidatus Omnitrophota bacterium]MBU2222302.1 FIST C-terminal domain-containing protein [Candidatus Omnitrophota bacterium]MBU2257651.1 FIST C-terminal domain-containing protein [Candidatus Omnitrophota bacterium]
MDIGVGLSLEKNPIIAVKEALRSAQHGVPKGKPDLAILFSSPELSSSTMLKTIHEIIGAAPIIGSTGIAIISNQGVFNQGLVLMLLKLPENAGIHTSIINTLNAAADFESGKEMAERFIQNFHYAPRTFGLLLSDNVIEESSGLVRALREKFGTSFPLIGAYNSEADRSQRNYLYYNNELSRNSCAAMFLGGRVNFGFGTKHGWEPLGKQHTITSSRDNVIKTIDGKPAVKLYEDYLGCPARELKHGPINIPALYPLGMPIPGEKEYLLRNINFVDEDSGSLHFHGSVPEGGSVRLMIATKETCLNAAKQAIKQSKLILSSGLIPRENAKRFALVFNSLARYTILKKEVAKELDIIKAELEPGTPIIGLYSYGGLIPLKSTSCPGQAYCNNQNLSILIVGG